MAQPSPQPHRRTKAPPIKPLVKHTKVLAKAMQLRDQLPGCNLSDDAIALVAARVNTAAPTAQIARQLGLTPHLAYVILGRSEAQTLMAQLATSVLGAAALTGAHTMVRLMGNRDPHVAFKAADVMMERAGLGISQRSTPGSVAPKTVFSFSFGDGTHPKQVASAPALKNEGSVSGEGESRAILQPDAAEQVLQPSEGEVVSRPAGLKNARGGRRPRIHSLKGV